MTDHNQLEKMVNEDTKSVFYVIGGSDNVRLGVRFWSFPPDGDKLKTIVAMRARLELRDTSITPISFVDYISNMFPKAKWAGKSEAHVSILGAIQVSIPVWEVDQMMAKLREIGAGNHLYDYLTNMLEGIEMVHSKEAFSDFFFGMVERDAIANLVPQEDAKLGTVMEFKPKS